MNIPLMFTDPTGLMSQEEAILLSNRMYYNNSTTYSSASFVPGSSVSAGGKFSESQGPVLLNSGTHAGEYY
jgi:hypothetical protein